MIKATLSPTKISFYLMGHRIVSTILYTLAGCAFVLSAIATLAEIKFILQ